MVTGDADPVYLEIQRYVCFDEADKVALSGLSPLLAPHFAAIVDDFYARIEAHPHTARVITGGPAQIRRLKDQLLWFLERFFLGPWDDAYFEQRARIGRRHVQVGLEQHYMMTAMAGIREHLCRAASEVTPAQERSLLDRRLTAINKLCDLELAVMLHTFREDTLARLKASERLATFGQLMSAICHELRNPLGVIETSAFLLGQRAHDPGVAEHVHRIQRHVRRSTRIISSMLDIVRDNTVSLRTVPPADLARRAIQVLREERNRTAALEVAPERPPAVRTDPDLCLQIIGNLLQNAADATLDVDGAWIGLFVQASGREVHLVVEDNGPGLSESVRTRLFEPLVTTKDTGVGLGLALSAKLARQVGGRLELAQSHGPGAAFRLVLPRA